MLLKSNDSSFIRKYTVENKNIPNLERVLKRKIWQNRYINLYTKTNQWFFFPIWAKQYIEHEDIKRERLDITFNGELDWPQKKALRHIMMNWCGLIDMKTWGWKSFLAMWIINLYKLPTLIIVPTTKLLIEMKDKIKTHMNYDVWVFYSAKKEIKQITITTQKSYTENDLWHFPIIIFDECDTWLSRTMIDKLNISDVDILVGMTWTPTRIELDTKDLELFFWPYIQCWWYKEVPTEAIQYVYRRTQAEKNLYVWDSFAETRTVILQNETRLSKIVQKCLEIKSKYNIMLILTDRIEECEILQSMLPWSVVINWGTKLKNDNEHIERIRKEWWIIIGTRQKMGRWVDVPEIDCVCLVWAFKFKSAVIQAIWRALRKFPWKNDIGVYVFSDDVMRWQMYENKKTLESEYKIQVSRQFLN